MMRKAMFITGLLMAVVPLAAQAQVPGAQAAAISGNVKALIEEFNKGNYTDAAYRFFDVVENDANQSNQLAAEYFLGASLLKLKYYQPAYYFFSGIVKTGPNHPFFEKAVEGVVEAADGLKDDLFTPELLMRYYTSEFSRLQPETLNHINYTIGELAYRKGKLNEAQQFLGVIPASSRYFTRSKYLQGMIYNKANRVADSKVMFNDIINATARNTDDDYQLAVRNLAIMALARIDYKNGDFKQSAALYDSVPRFSSEWIDALFEAGWTYFRLEDYGTALGRVHTLFAPNYQGQFQPEAFVLKATVYYYACLYNEVKATLNEFYKRYKDMP
ncbi:MAG: hypothetical protein WC889_17405, partial [Myxococcota bacterium]